MTDEAEVCCLKCGKTAEYNSKNHSYVRKMQEETHFFPMNTTDVMIVWYCMNCFSKIVDKIEELTKLINSENVYIQGHIHLDILEKSKKEIEVARRLLECENCEII